MAGKPLAVRGVHICNKMIPKWKAMGRKHQSKLFFVEARLWMEQDRGWGTAHTSVYGGYGSWRGAGLAGSEALHPKGPHERNRLTGGRGGRLLWRSKCRGNDRWRCEQESRGTPQEKGVCNHIVISYPTSQGLPDSSVGKNLPVKAGDTGSIPGSGRSPREGNSNPLQYPCLGNTKDRGTWWATVLGVAKVRHGLVTKRQ